MVFTSLPLVLATSTSGEEVGRAEVDRQKKNYLSMQHIHMLPKKRHGVLDQRDGNRLLFAGYDGLDSVMKRE